MSAPGTDGGCGVDAAAYVLGALTEEEHDAFREHVRECAACREEVALLEPVARSLPAAVPQLSAPESLRDRVMSTVRTEAALRAASSRPPRPARRRSAARLPWRWVLGSVAATAATVLVAALLIGGSGETATRTIRAQAPAHTSASLRIHAGRATLQVAGMPRTPPGKVYEVWVKRSAGAMPTDALFTVSSAGDATVAVPGTIRGVRTVMVTAEPLGGSRKPTSPPVLVANIS